MIVWIRGQNQDLQAGLYTGHISLYLSKKQKKKQTTIKRDDLFKDDSEKKKEKKTRSSHFHPNVLFCISSPFSADSVTRLILLSFIFLSLFCSFF